MADGTGIAWTSATWNPVTGCTKVSPGCDHCYAETFAERWRGTPGHHFEQGFDLTLRPERLDQPLRWRRPRRIFVNSMSDLFHDDIPVEFIAQVFAVMELAPQHTFQVLTKRHGRMRATLSAYWFRQLVDTFRERIRPGCGDFVWPLRNVWLGVSVENNDWLGVRVPKLLDTPAAVRFISAEPLLGPLDDLADECWQIDPEIRWIDWVIVGGESGPGSRPMELDWARDIAAACAAAGVPVFVKQLGTVLARSSGIAGKGDKPTEWPEPFPQDFPQPLAITA